MILAKRSRELHNRRSSQALKQFAEESGIMIRWIVISLLTTYTVWIVHICV